MMSAGLLLLGLAGAPEPTHAYAIIVANNTSTDSTLAKLRYADDDGARWTELLSLVTEKSELLSVLDPETQQTYPELARRARPPSSRELDLALAETFAAIERDNAQQIRTLFYFVFVGHGSVGDDGEGSIHLLDGRFTRSELYQRVIARSPARFNHVIIDACNAYLMIARRGGAEDRAAVQEALKSFIGKEGLDRYPNTGVLVSTSKAAEVHEWSRFEAGIFSHEARSALAGAADVDLDGAVTYDEARAFVSAANIRVKDPKAKLEAFASAPALHRAEPLFDRRSIAKPLSVHVPGALGGHRWLEDARGVRFADFNLAPDQRITLAVVPSPTYFLRNEEEEIKIPLEVSVEVDAGTLPRTRTELAQRGSEAITFQRDLFAVPFGRAYFEGFRASVAPESSTSLEMPRDEGGMPLMRVAAGGVSVAAVAVIAAGILFGQQASDRAEVYRTAIGTNAELDALREDAASAARTSNILYAVGGGLVAGAALLWLLPSD